MAANLMNRLAAGIAALLIALPAFAEDPSFVTEDYLHQGRFNEGETALLLLLDETPDDDEARFGLGVIQFLRAVEHLGRALHEYGAVSDKSQQPFLRLPVPLNKAPSTISYEEFGRVLDAFASDLSRAEGTLAQISDNSVKLKLRLAQISFNFTQDKSNTTPLMELISRFGGGKWQGDPDFRIHFDRGDVAWLRAYCHLLSGMVDGYRSTDVRAGFNRRVGSVFPKTEAVDDDDPAWYKSLTISDAPRLRRMRQHFAMVGELNAETWKFIREETDDDFEWLSHPKQTDQLGLPMTDRQIDAWLNFMQQFEELMKGERLIPGMLLGLVASPPAAGQGLNVRKLLDDPPLDLFNHERLRKDGIDPKYLEDETQKPAFDIGAVFMMFQLFNGPQGFARAVRMN